MYVTHSLRALTLALAFAPPVAASDSPSGQATEECWKGSFSQQLSGLVRELPATGRGVSGTKAVASEYVFCFTKRLDDGGTLIANGRRIQLDRIGSIRRPPIMQEGVFRSSSSIRDVRDFPRLYGIFSTPGNPDTSLEIQLEPMRERVTVVSGTRDQAGRRIVSLLEGAATRMSP
jgi:hypothetical protein